MQEAAAWAAAGVQCPLSEAEQQRRVDAHGARAARLWPSEDVNGAAAVAAAVAALAKQPRAPPPRRAAPAGVPPVRLCAPLFIS